MNGMERTSRTERRRATGARRIGAVITCAVAVAAAPAASWADDAAMAKDAGVGLGSAIASLLYAPVKTAYALGGVVVGGLAWAFSGGDAEVARVVLEPSVLGDYVITTGHLTGQQQIEFFGRQDEPASAYQDRYRETPPESDVASAPEGW